MDKHLQDELEAHREIIRAILETDFPHLGPGYDVLRMACHWRGVPKETLEKVLEGTKEKL